MSEQEYKMAVAADKVLKQLSAYKKDVEENFRFQFKGSQSDVLGTLQSDIEKAILKAENAVRDAVEKCC